MRMLLVWPQRLVTWIRKFVAWVNYDPHSPLLKVNQRSCRCGATQTRVHKQKLWWCRACGEVDRGW